MMKIGINVSWMNPGQAGGMEWYVRNLIDQLGSLDQENEYVLVTSPNNYKTFHLPSSKWKMRVYLGGESSPRVYQVSSGVPVQRSQRLLFLRRVYRKLKSLHSRMWTGRLAELIDKEGIDLWFCPIIYALPPDAKVPIVTTIPDLQHEYYPDFFPENELALRVLGYQYSCKTATATIAISDHVAADIVRLYGIDPGRVFAIPLALSQDCQIPEDEIRHLVDKVRLKFRLDQDFIYYPANGWRHKNHENLVKALAIAHSEGKRTSLILTGSQFGVMDRLRPLLTEYGLQKAVRHLGYVDRQDVIGLYALAKMLVFPSLFEGFGLPVLEALHFGTPVACSNVGSLSGVGGNAALYFDPHSPQDIAAAILKITEQEELRERLVAKGREQVKRFSYFDTARKTLEVFEKIRSGTLVPPELPPFRPLLPHKWLQEGHSRWYFHCTSLREVEFEVVQPFLNKLTDQTIEAWLDGQKMLESPIEPQRLYRFVIPASDKIDAGFHRLDIWASATASVGGRVLSVQVPSIVITDSSGNRLRLIK